MEYINLKQTQGSKDDLDPRCVSLKTQYSNIKTEVSNLSSAASSQIVLLRVSLLYAVRSTEKEEPD